MDKRVKALWIEALESGEYEQTTGQLRYQYEDQKPAFCCLGVLCEVAVKDGLDIEFDPEKDSYDEYTAFLPGKVQKWAGLGSGEHGDDWDDSGQLPTPVRYTLGTGEYEDHGTATTLLSLNDGANYTFAQIAKVIEEQF